jgi:multicomponent Na+:H+ antiporter subunit B
VDSLIDIVLFAFLAVTAVAVARSRDLFAGVMLFGIFSLLSASLFLLMDAADVAFTEAAVGAGISTVLLLASLSLTGREEKPARRAPILPLAVVLVTGAALIWGTLDMPHFGNPDNPAQVHVAPRYLQQSGEEIGIPNVVTSVLASYRGFDTFGEVVVIFAAGIGVMMLIGGRKRRRQRKEHDL